MGGKKRGAPRQEKRVNALATELIEATTESQLASIPDSDLFMLDTKPDVSIKVYSRRDLQRKRQQQQQQQFAEGTNVTKKRRKVILSEKELRQVKKIISNKKKANQITTEGSNRTATKSFPKEEVYDLWEHTVADDSRKQMKTKNLQPTVAIDIAHSGQSYRPDEELHQNIVGEALAIELRRSEAELYNKTPIASGMSEDTLAVLVGDTDDDDDEDEQQHDTDPFQPKKIKEKLTRAQRNKRRRAKEMQAEHESRKRTKRLLNAVSNLPSIKKELAKEELTKKARKEELSRLKEEAKSIPLGKNLHVKLVERDPLKAPSLPVVLPSELKEGGCSLRTVKPKGDLLSERLHSLAERKLANSKRTTRNIVQGKKRTVRKGMEYLLL